MTNVGWWEVFSMDMTWHAFQLTVINRFFSALHHCRSVNGWKPFHNSFVHLPAKVLSDLFCLSLGPNLTLAVWFICLTGLVSAEKSANSQRSKVSIHWYLKKDFCQQFWKTWSLISTAGKCYLLERTGFQLLPSNLKKRRGTFLNYILTLSLHYSYVTFYNYH